MHFRAASLLVVGVLSTGALALGINCRGSSRCGDQPGDTLQRIYDLIQREIDPAFFFPNGRQIACASSVCAFLQNSPGANGQLIKDILTDLRDHDCKICGSVPTLFRNGTNDVDKGELTLNFVSQPCGDATASCLGMLPQFQ